LELLAAEVVSELAAQERRSDALDSKAGILLGFAGVIVGLAAQDARDAFEDLGLAAAALSAALAGAAALPRSFPTMDVYALRQSYLTQDADVTRLRVLDTRIAMYRHTQQLLQKKARLVIWATAALGLAVVFAVIGAIVK
jgi:hypothetical protein